VIVEVEPAGEDDLRAGRKKDLLIGTLFRHQEVTAVDHRRGEIAMVDPRPAARDPCFAHLALVVFGGLIAHQLEGVLAFDQGLPFGDQALEFD